jgi:hypothetical protein
MDFTSPTVPLNQWVTIFVSGQAYGNKIFVDGIGPSVAYGGRYYQPIASTTSDPFQILQGTKNVKIRNVLLLDSNPIQTTVTFADFRFDTFDESHPYFPKTLAFFKEGSSLTDLITGVTLEVKH